MNDRIEAIEILAAAARYTPRREVVEDVLLSNGLFDAGDLEAAWVAQKIVDALDAFDESQDTS